MKFGKQYDFHKIPEWAEHYFDYNSLKKLLKSFHKKHLNSNLYNTKLTYDFIRHYKQANEKINKKIK